MHANNRAVPRNATYIGYARHWDIYVSGLPPFVRGTGRRDLDGTDARAHARVTKCKCSLALEILWMLAIWTFQHGRIANTHMLIFRELLTLRACNTWLQRCFFCVSRVCCTMLLHALASQIDSVSCTRARARAVGKSAHSQHRTRTRNARVSRNPPSAMFLVQRACVRACAENAN